MAPKKPRTLFDYPGFSRQHNVNDEGIEAATDLLPRALSAVSDAFEKLSPFKSKRKNAPVVDDR